MSYYKISSFGLQFWRVWPISPQFQKSWTSSSISICIASVDVYFFLVKKKNSFEENKHVRKISKTKEKEPHYNGFSAQASATPNPAPTPLKKKSKNQTHKNSWQESWDMGESNDFKLGAQILDIQQNRMDRPIHHPINGLNHL